MKLLPKHEEGLVEKKSQNSFDIKITINFLDSRNSRLKISRKTDVFIEENRKSLINAHPAFGPWLSTFYFQRDFSGLILLPN